MKEATGNRYIAEFLKAAGTSHFFYVPVLFPEAIKAMTELGVEPIVTHSEKAAAYMADGYARVAKRPGLCGSQHIGGSNLAASMRDPLMAKSPVVAITGGAMHTTAYKGLYQDVDDRPTFASLTKWTGTVDIVSRLPDMLDKAYRRACSGRPGPVHLQLPGFWGAVAAEPLETSVPIGKKVYELNAYRPVPGEGDLRKAAEIIAKARRPIIVAGTGAILSSAEAVIMAFCENFDIPVATATAAKALAPDDHPCLVGVCGEYSRESANIAVSESDLVIYIGSNTGGLVTRNWSIPPEDRKVVQIDIDSSDMGRNYSDTFGLLGDARATLEALGRLITEQRRPKWMERIKQLKEQWTAESKGTEASDAVPMLPERLCHELSEVLPEDAILVVDTGHAPGWMARNMRITSTKQSVIRAAGSLGWGFPAAIGAKAAAPDRPVVCFTGDGGFYYHLAELETALRYDLPMVTVLNNNSALNQERFIWEADDRHARNWRFKDVDFVSVAEGFGAWAIRVDQPEDVGSAITEALKSGRPAVIDARTDDTAVVPKSWGPGSGDPYRSE